MAVDALKMALTQRGRPEQLVHQCDRGSQYASKEYQRWLGAYGIECSMSRWGNCWDNAMVKSFFATLKTEFLYQTDDLNTEEAKSEIFESIEVFYNRQRHSTLGYETPADLAQAAQAT
ncbi:IS3 family transposase [Rubidibacter lacunae]|uniref:IS3 family transposase n=1 Tax=Rubidibacter lacunae TaxID=582514 RepID=UPI00042580C8|nr:IS3 family transposase [Rubidibacter lacunae]